MAKRTAIVTDSSRGIGEALARRLAAEKYAVSVNDVQAKHSGIDNLVAELNQKYGERTAICIAAGVTKSAEVHPMVEESGKAL